MTETTLKTPLKLGVLTRAYKFGTAGNATSYLHPVYQDWIDEWMFLINAFEGGQVFLRENYLYQHLRESNDAYADRKERAYYLNYVKMVINLWTSYVKTIPPKRILQNTDFDNFRTNVDLKGTPLDIFWLGRVFPLVEVMGMVHIILTSYIPSNVDQEQVKSYADQLNAGIKDMLILRLPQTMTNWSKNLDDTYNWVIFKNDYVKQDNWNVEPELITDYTIITKTQELTFDGDGKLSSTKDHNLGFVPVITAYGKRSEQDHDLGIGNMYDVAIINREVFNLSSLIQEFLYKQCFNFLAGHSDLLTDEEGKVKLGSASILPIIDGVKPEYVTPPIDPAEFLQTEREKLIQEMYRHSILRDKSIEKNDPASGIAKAYDFNETGQNLAEKISSLETADNQLCEMWARKSGNELPKGQKYVEYPREYDIKTLNQELMEATEIFKLNLSETLNKEKGKIVARKALPNIDEKRMKVIETEIDAKNPADNDIFQMNIGKLGMEGDYKNEFNQRERPNKE